MFMPNNIFDPHDLEIRGIGIICRIAATVDRFHAGRALI